MKVPPCGCIAAMQFRVLHYAFRTPSATANLKHLPSKPHADELFAFANHFNVNVRVAGPFLGPENALTHLNGCVLSIAGVTMFKSR